MKLYRHTLQKSDGRLWHQYSLNPFDKEVVIAREGLVRHERWQAPFLRYNPMRGEWVAISASRQDRPFLPPKEYCPLCPSADDQWLTEVPDIDRPYEWAVFENMYPGFSLKSSPPSGHCEVILYTRHHQKHLADLSPVEIRGLIGVWQDRSADLGRRPELDYVFIFENRGAEVGVTLHHAHGQLYAFHHVPPFIEKEHALAVAHFIEHKECFLCGINKREADGPRIVWSSQHLVAYVPEAARFPFEVHVSTRRHCARVEQLNDDEINDLSQALPDIVRGYDGLFGQPMPYMMVHHQAPHKSGHEQAFHWHIEFYPIRRAPGKLKYLAGVESGTGLFINDTIPEVKADELRQAIRKAREQSGGRLVVDSCVKTRVWAPGRINLIGEHTDYNGGWVLPMAIDKGITITLFRTGENNPDSPALHVVAADLGEEYHLDARILSLVDGQESNIDRLLSQIPKGWQRYVIGALWQYIRERPVRIKGQWRLDIVSTLPAGGGLSSSAALTLGCLQAFAATWSSPLPKSVAARCAMLVEHEFVGTRCGMMDQLAILHAIPDHLCAINFAHAEPVIEMVPVGDLFKYYCCIAVNSQVHHSLADSPYNQRRDNCRKALEFINNHFRHLAPPKSTLGEWTQEKEFSIAVCGKDWEHVTQRDLSAALGKIVGEALARQAGHALCESVRVTQMRQAIRLLDYENIDALLNLGHQSLSRDYQVSCQEIDMIVHWGREWSRSMTSQSGVMFPVLGPRMTGGGFGGNVIQLVHRSVADDYISAWGQSSHPYCKTWGVRPTTLSTGTCKGLSIER